MDTPEPESPPPFLAQIPAASLRDAIEACSLALKEPDRRSCDTLTLSFESNKISIRGQTNAFGLERRITAAVTSPRPDLVVNADNFARAVKACELGVDLTADEDGQICLKDPTGFSVVIPPFEPGGDKLPAWPKRTVTRADGLRLGAAPCEVNLGRLLKRVATHASTDPSRMSIHGIAFEHTGDGRGNLVATDGHRLAILDLDFEFPATPITILSPLVAALVEDDKTTGIAITDTHVFFDTDSSTAWSKIIKVTFPPWRSVLPYYFEYKGANDKQRSSAAEEIPSLTVDRSELACVTKQFAAISVKGNHVTLKSHDDVLKLKGQVMPEEQLEGSCEIDTEGTTGSKTDGLSNRPSRNAQVMLNPEFLADAVELLAQASISSQDQRIRLQWAGPLDPITISDRPCRNVVIVMPVRSE